MKKNVFKVFDILFKNVMSTIVSVTSTFHELYTCMYEQMIEFDLRIFSNEFIFCFSAFSEGKIGFNSINTSCY